jgi:hypothetical protein
MIANNSGWHGPGRPPRPQVLYASGVGPRWIFPLWIPHTVCPMCNSDRWKSDGQGQPIRGWRPYTVRKCCGCKMRYRSQPHLCQLVWDDYVVFLPPEQARLYVPYNCVPIPAPIQSKP